MHKQLLIVMLICLKGADYISAQQWTKKDSVWLQNVSVSYTHLTLPTKLEV